METHNGREGMTMTRAEVSIQRCVACGSERWVATERWQSYQLVTCSECGLTYTVNPDYCTGRYVVVYEGASGDIPVPEEQRYIYAQPEQRLKLESLAFWAPPPRLTPAEKGALKWLTTHAPKRALVIDCGCGVGRFQRALQRTGFQGLGVEVSDALVASLNRSGLTAIKGEAPDFPWDGAEPYAITFFEVLEHLPDPAEVLLRLRVRFPKSAILASVPSPRRASLLRHGQREAFDFPPHHFLRWTPKALEIVFQRLEFAKVVVEQPPPIGSELMLALGQILPRTSKARCSASVGMAQIPDLEECRSVLKRTAATALVWTHRGYQVAADVVGAPKAWFAARHGASAASMLVIAEP